MLIVWALSQTPFSGGESGLSKEQSQNGVGENEGELVPGGCCAVGWGSLAALPEVITGPR